MKDWDINIYRGILTGYNEAFIIDGEKRKQLIEEDAKSAEIIRPLLRGRDIKRYAYEFADLYLIATFPSLKINIEEYQAVKAHLTSFGVNRLQQTGENGTRKKTNNKWFETQDSIAYWEDFFRPKIIYPEITKFLNFCYDESDFLANNKCFILTGEKIYFLIAFFNSSLFKYCFRDDFPELLGGSRELRKVFLEKIPVLKVDNDVNLRLKYLVEKMQSNASRSVEIEIDNILFELYNLNTDERKEIGFIEIQ